MSKRRFLIYDDKYYSKIYDQEQSLYYYLGSWCLKDWQVDKHIDIKPDSWIKKQSLVEDIDYVEEFTMRVIKSSYQVLKNHFKKPLTVDEFASIYYSWTFNIIVKLLANWKLFDDSQNTDLTYVFDIQFESVIAENLLDSNMTYFYSKWNLFIISEIIKFRKIDYIELKYIENTEINNHSLIKDLVAIILRTQQIIFNYFKFKYNKKPWIFYYFTKQSNLLAKFQKNDTITQYVQLIYFNYKRKLKKFNINKISRESLILEIQPKNSFEIFFSKQFFKILPKSLFEGIDLLEKHKISNYLGNKPTHLVYSDFLNNELLLYNLTQYKKNQVYVYQHGGGFGFNNYTIIEKIEKFYCSKYITWGWKKSEIDLPFFSPDFNQLFKINKSFIRKNICIILYDSPPFIPAFQPTIFSNHYSNYLISIKDFLDKTDFKDQFTIRLYPRNDSGIDLINFFPKSINIDNSNNLDILYSKYELYVYTYNSTGFLELWSLNIPCILYIKSENWFVDEFGLDEFKNLEKNNLLITNLKDIELLLMNNTIEINTWWNSNNIQYAKNNFLKIYANNNIKKEYIKDLKDIFNIN